MFCSFLNCVYDGFVTSAAAEISGKCVAYFRARGVLFLSQQLLRCHKHARRAKAALDSVSLVKGGLQVRDFPAVGQSLYRDDFSSIGLNRKGKTPMDDRPIQ
jgi:hypothetical protein